MLWVKTAKKKVLEVFSPFKFLIPYSGYSTLLNWTFYLKYLNYFNKNLLQLLILWFALKSCPTLFVSYVLVINFFFSKHALLSICSCASKRGIFCKIFPSTCLASRMIQFIFTLLQIKLIERVLYKQLNRK